MPINRRAFLAGSAGLVATRGARAATLTDDAGRTVPVPATVQRVYPAGLPAAILLYTLAPELLLGWPHANRPEVCAYLLPQACDRPELARLTGRDDRLDLGSLAALKPDLILDVGSTGARYVALAESVQKQSGISYALLDGGVLSLSTTYEKLGRFIGREAAGLDFADYCNMTLAVITNRIAFVKAEKRPRIYYARGPQGLITGLSGSSQMESIELLARNVAGGTKGGLTDVTVEQVRQWNPDLIVATDAAFAAKVRTDSVWGSMKAVRDGHVHVVPKMPFGWVDTPPSGNRLIGLWWLAIILYPELFNDDMRELARDFYTKFYHVTPSDLRLDYVLAGKS